MAVTGTSRRKQIPCSLTEIITEQRGFFASKSSKARALLKIGDSPADPAHDPTEAATFAALAQALLNLDANVTLR